MNHHALRQACAAGTTALIALLSGCSPVGPHERIDMTVSADGSCAVAGQVVDCIHAGEAATARHEAAALRAVLLIDPAAPQTSVTALRTSLQSAHVTHVQYGDPKNMKLLKPTGIE